MLSRGRVLSVQAAHSIYRRYLTLDLDCSFFTRLCGSKLYPGPQASLKNRSFLPGSTSDTFPESLNGPRHDFPIFSEANTDVSLTPRDWAKVCREKLDVIMPRYSAVVFRGLPLHSAETFNEFFAGCSYGQLSYIGGTGVREKIHSQVYISTVEPQEYNIELHNEMSYWPTYNHKIMFCCIVPPLEGHGGITPICNNRDIFAEIDPRFIDKLRQNGIRYSRYCISSDAPGTLSWQNIFETNSKQGAEKS